MSWTPAFPEMDFGDVLFENLAMIVKRDQTAALAWANGGPGLSDFARVLTCERVSKQFPALAIIPNADNPTIEEEGYVNQSLEVIFEISIISNKPEAMTVELRKRVKAMRMLVITAVLKSLPDLTSGMGANRDNVSLELGRAVYEQGRETDAVKGLYYRSAFILFTFTFNQGG